MRAGGGRRAGGAATPAARDARGVRQEGRWAREHLPTCCRGTHTVVRGEGTWHRRSLRCARAHARAHARALSVCRMPLLVTSGWPSSSAASHPDERGGLPPVVYVAACLHERKYHLLWNFLHHQPPSDVAMMGMLSSSPNTFLVGSILSPGQGWHRRANAQVSIVPRTGLAPTWYLHPLSTRHSRDHLTGMGDSGAFGS